MDKTKKKAEEEESSSGLCYVGFCGLDAQGEGTQRIVEDKGLEHDRQESGACGEVAAGAIS